jgi:5-methylcytosine-specific restriction endonuclease McrA
MVDHIKDIHKSFLVVLRKKIKIRDNNICQLCNMTEQESLIKFKRKLAINHIDFNKQNNNDTNLNVLCMKCNSKVNFNREYYTWYFQTKLKYRKLWDV